MYTHLFVYFKGDLDWRSSSKKKKKEFTGLCLLKIVSGNITFTIQTLSDR